MPDISPPTWLEDTPTRCRVFFFHRGAMENAIHDLGFFVSPNDYWWIPQLQVREGNRPLNVGGDYVNIVGGARMQHTVSPHPEDPRNGEAAIFGGLDPTASGGPSMNAAAFPDGGFIRNSVDVPHGDRGHKDRYSLGLQIVVNGPDITAYRISFTAEHLGAHEGDPDEDVTDDDCGH